LTVARENPSWGYTHLNGVLNRLGLGRSRPYRRQLHESTRRRHCTYVNSLFIVTHNPRSQESAQSLTAQSVHSGPFGLADPFRDSLAVVSRREPPFVNENVA